MRKKTAFLVVFVVMIINFFMLCFNLYDLFIKKHDWVITSAVTTFIEIPGGDVLGSYTDSNGVFHENVPIYDPIDAGYDVDFKAYEKGKNVWIIYDPNQVNSEYGYVGSRSENFFYVIMRIAVSAVCLTASGIFLIIHRSSFDSGLFWRVIILPVLIVILTYAAVRVTGALFAGILPELSVYILQYRRFIVLAAIVIYILSKINKKKAAIVCTIITAIMFANSADDLFVEKKDWIVTDGTVESMNDSSYGYYYGSYIDENGKIQEHTHIYYFPPVPFSVYDRYGFDLGFIYEPLVNNEILIHYDPSTVLECKSEDENYTALQDSELYFTEVTNLVLSAVLFVASLVFLVLNIKPKVSKTDAQSGSNNKIQGSAVDSADIINS